MDDCDKSPPVGTPMMIMTQDAVAWDESKNVDLRKIATTTQYGTPFQDTPSEMKNSRISLSEVTGSLGPTYTTNGREKLSEEEIEGIFCRLDQGQTDAKEQNIATLATPKFDNTLAQVAARNKGAPTIEDVHTQKRPRRHEPRAMCTTATEYPSREETTFDRSTMCANDFEELLQEVATPSPASTMPPPSRRISNIVPLTAPLIYSEQPIVQPSNRHKNPINKHALKPKNVYRQNIKQASINNIQPVHSTIHKTSNVKEESKDNATGSMSQGKIQNTYLKGKDERSVITRSISGEYSTAQRTALSRNISTTQPTQIHKARPKPTIAGSPSDEFDVLELCQDDLVVIDSIVLGSSQERLIETNRNVNCTANKSDDDDMFGGLKDEDLASLDDTNASVKPSAMPPVEDDMFGDFPEMDFEALDRSIAKNGRELCCQNGVYAVPHIDAIVKNPRSNVRDNGRSHLTFSRYKVLHVAEDLSTYTKTLSVADWDSGMINADRHQSIHHVDTEEEKGRNIDSKTWPTVGVIHLRGEWYHTRIFHDDIIHLCSLMGHYRTDSGALPIVLHTSPPDGSDKDDLVLVVHPDMLLTPTGISETISCTRRAVIKHRLGSTGLTSKAPLLGTLRHELFAQLLRDNDFSEGAIAAHIDLIVRRNAEGLIACGLSTKEAAFEMRKFVPFINEFTTQYTEFRLHGRAKAINDFTILESYGHQNSLRFIAKCVEAVEEPVISPELGLKGNVDMIVQAKTARASAIGSGTDNVNTSLVGIELKTGHNQNTQNAHVAQLALYTLLLQVKYGSTAPLDVNSLGYASSGILLYMNDKGTRVLHVTPLISEIKSLLGQRNVLATEARRVARPRGVVLKYDDISDHSRGPRIELQSAPPAALPDVISNASACNKCYAARECMIYAGSDEALSENTEIRKFQSHADLIRHYTGHLRKTDFDYFLEWDRLIDLEADASNFLTAELWLVSSHERERTTAKTMSNMIFDQYQSSSQAIFDGSWHAVLCFRRKKHVSSSVPLVNMNFERGCHVIVSADCTTVKTCIQEKHVPSISEMHIVRGIFYKATENEIFIRASGEDLVRVQGMVAGKTVDGEQYLFRLDRDDVSTGVGTIRQNLVKLFTGDYHTTDETKDNLVQQRRLPRLREILVRLKKPMFDELSIHKMFSTPDSAVQTFTGCDLIDLCLEFTELNIDQRHAAEKVFSAKDYSLIQGLPGTGKTSTIAFLVRLLVAHGKRVLVTSYTHSAVDNVMMKLLEKGLTPPSLVRIGKKSSCHSSIVPVLAQELAKRKETTGSTLTSSEGITPLAESLKQTISDARVVGITALSVPRSPLLVDQHFDYVIVDEAGQISQPAILGALMAADLFVLVGDHMQLPPLVNSELAELGGFGISMLKRLAEKHPEAVAQLTHQYRMNDEICQLSNDIVYKGMLKCGTEEVRSQKLELPGFPNRLPSTEGDWLERSIDPSLPVIFLNTDKLRSSTIGTKPNTNHYLERFSGRSKGGSIVNDTEVNVVRAIVNSFLVCGVPPTTIGVICPFRAQLRLLDDCTAISEWKSAGLEISTIDRYQGRDKPIIVLSFVRSNSHGRVGRLLEDFRRINVAITRAKYKLIMIGSFSTLDSGSEILRPVLNRMKANKLIVDIPENGLANCSQFSPQLFHKEK